MWLVFYTVANIIQVQLRQWKNVTLKFRHVWSLYINILFKMLISWLYILVHPKGISTSIINLNLHLISSAHTFHLRNFSKLFFAFLKQLPLYTSIQCQYRKSTFAIAHDPFTNFWRKKLKSIIYEINYASIGYKMPSAPIADHLTEAGDHTNDEDQSGSRLLLSHSDV